MNNIYIDMDGTLTPYDYEDYNDNRWLITPDILCKPPIITALPSEVIILTRVSTKREASLKRAWAKVYFPHNKILTTTRPKHKRVSPKDSILIDDYNKNLEEWREHGGIPFKFINNINSPRHDMVCVEEKGGKLCLLKTKSITK